MSNLNIIPRVNTSEALNSNLARENLKTTFFADNNIMPMDMDRPTINPATVDSLTGMLEDHVVGAEESPAALAAGEVVDASHEMPGNPTMIAAAIMGGIDSAATNYSNNLDLAQAHQGLGPNGTAFDADFHAEQQAGLNNQFSSMRQAGYTIGSLGGPWGLAASGIIGLGLHDWSGDSVNQVTTASTSGALVNASVGAM